MTSSFAIAAVAGILILAAVPLAILLRRPRALAPVMAVYGAFFLGVASLHAGFVRSEPLPSFEGLSSTPSTAMSRRQCAEIVRLLEEGRVILDRAPPRISVVQSRWEQLPQEAREAVVACVERGWPQGAGPAQVVVRPE